MRVIPLLLSCAVLLAGCNRSPTAPSQAAGSQPPASAPPAPSAPPGPPVWDVEANGVPRFIGHDYIDLGPIVRISRFRSGVGHSYADSIESCRSMKHYYLPAAGADWGRIPIYSPVGGTVTAMHQEWAGVQVEIQSQEYPAFSVVLFHVNPSVPVSAGTALSAGERIGTHIGSQTMSDVAVRVNTPQGMRLVPYAEALTDAVFEQYRSRGVAARAALVIARAERDASPLACSGETFASGGSLENWILLR